MAANDNACTHDVAPTAAGDAGRAELEAWLLGLVPVHPTLKLFFNGRELTAPQP